MCLLQRLISFRWIIGGDSMNGHWVGQEHFVICIHVDPEKERPVPFDTKDRTISKIDNVKSSRDSQGKARRPFYESNGYYWGSFANHVPRSFALLSAVVPATE